MIPPTRLCKLMHPKIYFLLTRFYGSLRSRAALALSLLIAAQLFQPLAAGQEPPRAVATQQPTASAQGELPQGVTLFTSIEGITEYRLQNGLRVLLFPEPSKPTFTVNITYLVGSRHENYGETGMAHLLEHLMFKGTPAHTNIYQELTARGATNNAATTFDYTNYFETLSASDANLEWAIKLEADRMINSFIAKKDLESEMTVVRNEFEAGENSASSALLKRMLGAAFDQHAYSHLPIGAQSDIENVPIERLQAFYKNYYQPDNALLLIAGRFDVSRALTLVAQSFGAIPKPARTLRSPYTVEPEQDGERSVTVRRVGNTQLMRFAYHIPSGAHDDSAALDYLSLILGDTPSGRLYKNLVETKRAVSVGASSFKLHDPGLVFFSAEAQREDSVEEIRALMLKTIEEMRTKPPTEEEMARARTAFQAGFEALLTVPETLGLFLSNWMGMGDWRLFFRHRDRLKKVTAADVQRVANAYLKESNRIAGVFVPTATPDRALIPPAPDLEALLKDYKGNALTNSGEAFDSSPAAIEARTHRGTTAGGLKFALLPKKTRSSTVTLSLTLHFGDEKSLMGRATAGNLTGLMLTRGTKRRTRQQIEDELTRLRTGGTVYGKPTEAGATIVTARMNLPASLRLIAELLREPSFPAPEFEQLKQERLTAIERQKSEPQTAAFDILASHMDIRPKGDVRHYLTAEEEQEEIRAATLNDVKKFYADFYGASNGEVAVVGDFDEEEIKRLLSELFDDWKSPRPFARVAETFHDFAPINKTVETPDKANAFLVAATDLDIRDDDADYPALVLGNYILGGGFLSSRLATRIRQKEGLSYNVNSVLSADEIDRIGSFIFTAIYAPQNAQKVEAAFREELERALREGFTVEEVEAAKAGLLQQLQVSRAQDQALAGGLAKYLFLGRTLDWDAELEKKIARLTPAEIKAAMSKHIIPSKISVVKAGDFAKATTK